MYIKIEKIAVNSEIMQYESAFIGVLYCMSFECSSPSEHLLARLKHRHFATRVAAEKFYNDIQDFFPVIAASSASDRVVL